MVTIVLIRFVIPAVGLLLMLWQMRWLLRAYRRERDRHVAGYQSSRPRLLAAAVLVAAALASAAGVHAIRPIATGAILIVSMYEAARRRWFIGGETAAQM